VVKQRLVINRVTAATMEPTNAADLADLEGMTRARFYGLCLWDASPALSAPARVCFACRKLSPARMRASRSPP